MSSLIEHFSPLTDPRIEHNKKHQLIDIIVLSVSAFCSGANGWEAIEEFGHEKLEWLQQFILLSKGVLLMVVFSMSFHAYLPLRVVG